MKKHNRAYRRHQRARAINHATKVTHTWWNSDSPFNQYRFSCSYESYFVESSEERFRLEDEFNALIRLRATKIANHLAECSCYLCSPRQRSGRTFADKKQIQTLVEEWLAYF